MAAENNERYLRGKEVLARVEQNPHGSILDSLASFSPDLERFVVEFGYADVFDREGLSDQSRQLITISALAALGNAAPQLEFHINGALNVGCSPEQIIETFIHVTIYAGFPAALNVVSVARKVFAERGINVNLDTHSTEPDKRFEVGSSYLERVDGAGGEAVVESLQDIAPDLGRYIVEYSFGDVYSRPGLKPVGTRTGLCGCVQRFRNVRASAACSYQRLLECRRHSRRTCGTDDSDSGLCRIPRRPKCYRQFAESINGE